MEQCACQAGYERAGGGCVACAAGSFKAAAGDGPCSACSVLRGAGSTTVAPAATAGSQCVCAAGFTPSGGAGAACTACPAGGAKHVAGDQACIACPAHATLADNAVHNLSSCECDPGYTGPAAAGNGTGPACAPCGSGAFKAAHGPGACEACGAHAVTPTPTATSRAECACDAPTYEAHADGGPEQAGGGCVLSCAAGTTKSAGVCADCAAGTFKPDVGSHACTACAAERGAHTASRPGSDSAGDCSCPAGQMGLPADGFVAVEVGALSDDGLDEGALPAASVPADPARRLKELQLVGVAGESVEVAVEREGYLLVLFRCEPRDCADATVPLYGAAGALAVTTSADPAQFVLRRHTRRELILAASTPSPPAWFDPAAAEALAVERAVRSGDYILASASEYSASACAPCAPGLICGAYV